MGIIRLLLATAVVVIGHSTRIMGIRMISAGGAVQGFYVISGFYMALVLNEKYGTGARGYGQFMGQRLLRLLPGYWLCVVASVFLGVMGWGTHLRALGVTPIEFWRQHGGELGPVQLAYLIFNQAFLFGQDWLLFMGVSPGHGLYWTAKLSAASAVHFSFVVPAWSLGVELSFYAIAPFIVRRSWWVIAILAGMSMAVRLSIGLFAHLPLNADPWVYRFFPSELATFLLGSLGYHVYAQMRRQRWNIRAVGWASWIAALTAIFVVPLMDLPAESVVFYGLMALCVPCIFSLTKNWAVDRWVGELSYPLYIVHPIVGAALAPHMKTVPGWLLMSLSLPAAVLIRLAIEEPVDRWRHGGFTLKGLRRAVRAERRAHAAGVTGAPVDAPAAPQGRPRVAPNPGE